MDFGLPATGKCRASHKGSSSSPTGALASQTSSRINASHKEQSHQHQDNLQRPFSTHRVLLSNIEFHSALGCFYDATFELPTAWRKDRDPFPVQDNINISAVAGQQIVNLIQNRCFVFATVCLVG